MNYSIIVPVYNRPNEVDELLESLLAQTVMPYEIIIVEDGSIEPCNHIIEKYKDKLPVKYIVKENSGPGLSRNFGAGQATGDFFIFLDSDCILPPGYMEAADNYIINNPIDAFGGPDRAHSSFTPVQKAISIAMTSPITTGGIRGGKKSMETFHPRSFNMGLSRRVFDKTGGFSSLRFGEDIDLSLRIFSAGFKVALIPEAYVYHKRRTDLRKFYRQVYNSGMARINLYVLHPESLKLVHLLPSLFLAGSIIILEMALCILFLCLFPSFSLWASPSLALWTLSPLLLFSLLILFTSYYAERSIKVAFIAVAASFVQLYGYGAGFNSAFFQRIILGKKGEVRAFRETFYK